MIGFIVRSVGNMENIDITTVRLKSSLLYECTAANVTSTPEIQVKHYVCNNECTRQNVLYMNVIYTNVCKYECMCVCMHVCMREYTS